MDDLLARANQAADRCRTAAPDQEAQAFEELLIPMNDLEQEPIPPPSPLTPVIKGLCVIGSAIVAAAMVAGAANDIQALRLESQAGIPVPACANVSLLRPPCRQ